jgi:hypothetical protein
MIRRVLRVVGMVSSMAQAPACSFLSRIC